MSNRYEVEVELGTTKVSVQAVADNAEEAKAKVESDFSGDAVVGKAKKLSGGEESASDGVKTYSEDEVEARVENEVQAALAAKQAEIDAEVERRVQEELQSRLAADNAGGSGDSTDPAPAATDGASDGKPKSGRQPRSGN